ncbi:MAG: CRISPR-associated RAMP protein [Candidatus Brockarchaeota archaeon]|nr:CRISPR-associated RAMP protein [Candidatus Brockarchaeota archaeon]
MNYKDFDLIKLITRIEGELTNETPLRIGVGREPPLGAPVDIAVYRVDGKPCIPGSSLKGVFRSLAESIAASKGIHVHSPWDKEEVEREVKSGSFCPICGIFGSTELASHIRIYDAYPKDDSARTFTKTGVSIDREFSAARPGLLFTEELVVPNVVWSFRMDVLNIRFLPEPDDGDPRAGLLKSLLDYLLKMGISVGARKSVGSGLVKLRQAMWFIYSLEGGEVKKVSEGSLEMSK